MPSEWKKATAPTTCCQWCGCDDARFEPGKYCGACGKNVVRQKENDRPCGA